MLWVHVHAATTLAHVSMEFFTIMVLVDRADSHTRVAGADVHAGAST
jgi:hypothetical protein